MAARTEGGKAGPLLAIAIDREHTWFLVALHGEGEPLWFASGELVAVTRGS